MTDWNRGFQAGVDATEGINTELRRALNNLKTEHKQFVLNTSQGFLEHDQRYSLLENRLKSIFQECADICERRAESLREGSDVARLCKRDILSRSYQV